MWQVKKNGAVIAHGPDATFPDADARRQLHSAGYRIYRDNKIFSEKGDKQC